jgi:hypothetical protein
MGDRMSQSRSSPPPATVDCPAPSLGLLNFTGAGFTVVAVTFGLARYSYGLFIPEVGRAFGVNPYVDGPLLASCFAAF